MEGHILNSVLQRIRANDGVYIPADVTHGRHIFFAVDNVDFAEDTPDGKRTLHATAMAIYQTCEPEDELPKLELTQTALQGTSTKKDILEAGTKLLDCTKPAVKPTSPVYTSFSLTRDVVLAANHLSQVSVWLLARTLGETEETLAGDETGQGDGEETVTQRNIPTWSAYNSLIASELLPITRVGTPPLIAAPAHEWNTLLTVLKQAQSISAKVVGPDRKTVISLNMGLYKPAKQMQMAREDMNHIVLRPGELHIVMAELRCIGAYIENSGLDFCWTEADLYGPVTVKQILEGKHVNRGLEAHLVTLQSLFNMYQAEFFKDHPEMQTELTAAAEALNQAFADDSCENV